MPASQALVFEAARKQIQPAAEAHVADWVAPAVKAALDEIRHYRGDQLNAQISRLTDEVRRLPGEIVAEMVSPVGLGIAGHGARQAWSDLRAKAQMGSVARTFGQVEQALDARSLTEGTAGRMPS